MKDNNLYPLRKPGQETLQMSLIRIQKCKQMGKKKAEKLTVKNFQELRWGGGAKTSSWKSFQRKAAKKSNAGKQASRQEKIKHYEDQTQNKVA